MSSGARRAAWNGGVAASHEQLEAEELRFWAEASPSDRFNAVWQMALEAWTIGGENGAPPRLQGSPVGVRTRAG